MEKEKWLKKWITKNITRIRESKWMGSTPKAFKAAILKEAVRQNANSGGKVEKKEIRACRAEKHKKRTCK